MSSVPASDAITVVLLLGEVQEPHVLHAPGPCPYCKESVQMVSASFRNLYDGNLHTCPLYEVKRFGRRYVRGEFTLLAASSPTGGTTE